MAVNSINNRHSIYLLSFTSLASSNEKITLSFLMYIHVECPQWTLCGDIF